MIARTERIVETPRTLRKPMDTIREDVQSKHGTHHQEEKDSIFEIISDLEKQLEAAFEIKDAQEREIMRLKDELQKAAQRNAAGEAKIKEIQGILVAQEKMNLHLEFLENERLQSTEQISQLEENLKNIAIQNEDLIKKSEQSAREVKDREARIEQIEAQLNSEHSTIRNFQERIYTVEAQQEELQKKLEEARRQAAVAIEEKEKSQDDLKEATESLAEIRVMLADSRARGRNHKR